MGFFSNLARSLKGEPDRETGLSLLRPRIVVFGVGGAGGNAVNNMVRAKLKGVEFVAANTDAQALSQSLADERIQLGRSITEGLGAGSRAEIGRAAAEEGINEILDHLRGNHMAFITAGMGGGTGTGASPVIARVARDEGILTVGVVTKPFDFEGPNRMRTANGGIKQLQDAVDTLIVIPNQNLFRMANEKTTVVEAFRMADDVLLAGVRGLTELMVRPGLVNLDFADIRTVMSAMGKAMMGVGEAGGPGRAKEAAELGIANPLLSDISLKGARGVVVNVTGGRDLTLHEIDEAVSRVRDEVDKNANLIFGSAFQDGLDGRLRVTIFATGIGSEGSMPQKSGRNVSATVQEDDTEAAIEKAPAPRAKAKPKRAKEDKGKVSEKAASSEPPTTAQ